MTERQIMLRRWVVAPLFELAYVVVGALFGAVAFTVTMVGLALGVGLLPVFLIGIPVFAAVLPVVHVMTIAERGRASVLLGRRLPGRPFPAVTGGGWVRRLVARAKSPQIWKEIGYCIILLPLTVASAAIAVSLWSGALAGLLLPIYFLSLPPDQVVTWLDWPGALETAAVLAAGLVLLALAVAITRGLTRVNLWLAESLLSPDGEEALRAENAQLRVTRARVVDAADAERRRIERDLHDGAQQHLVSLAMNLGRAKTKFDSDPVLARGLVDQAHQEAKDSIVALRNVVQGVHPAVLTDRGLDAALSALAARSPIPVRVEVEMPTRADPTAEAVAYFVVSEALTNAARHSGAKQIDVRVERAADRLIVSVSDDGHGGAGPTPGGGLAGLRDRAAAVDGHLSIQSPPDGGTTVTLEVPCVS